MNRFVKMHPDDHVATALVNLKAGETGNIFDPENNDLGEQYALQDIPFGNKIALRNISKEDQVIKYGAVIGVCTRVIKQGELVHVHNVKSLAVDIPPAFKKEIMKQMNISVEDDHDDL